MALDIWISNVLKKGIGKTQQNNRFFITQKKAAGYKTSSFKY